MNKLIRNKVHYKVFCGDSIREIICSTKQALFMLNDLHLQPVSKKKYFERLKDDSFFLDLLIKHLYGLESKGDLKIGDMDDFLSIVDKYELFEIVDANDNPLYYDNGLPVLEFRKNCHGFGEYNWEYNNFHRSTLFLVLNDKDEILMSQRSSRKDTYPEYREFGGGHNSLGDDYEQTLKKEIKEELGLNVSQYTFNEIGKYRLVQTDKKNGQSQIMKIFKVKLCPKAKIIPEKKEISDYKFYPVFDLVKLLIDDNFKIVHHQRLLLINYLISLGVVFDEIIIQKNFSTKNMELEKID
ncbi:MAG: NUDIX hydrolase [Candidatus Absconditabacteria bacterium]